MRRDYKLTIQLAFDRRAALDWKVRCIYGFVYDEDSMIGGPEAAPDSRFSAVRKRANAMDINITITPVIKTNRSANKRRMQAPSRRNYSARNDTSTVAHASRPRPFQSHPSSRPAHR